MILASLGFSYATLCTKIFGERVGDYAMLLLRLYIILIMIIVLFLFLIWNYLGNVKIEYFDFGILLTMRKIDEDVGGVHVPMHDTPVVHVENS